MDDVSNLEACTWLRGARERLGGQAFSTDDDEKDSSFVDDVMEISKPARVRGARKGGGVQAAVRSFDRSKT